MKNTVKAGIFGICIGDALGVPVEFRSREQLKRSPVTTMRSMGSHRQPAGTWSDDSSLTLCLTDSLCKGYDLEDMALKFLQWYNEEIWTPYGRVFDIGIATSQAIQRIGKGIVPTLCGGYSEFDNGNGSLMRILPLAFYLKDEENIESLYQTVKEVSSITHGHFRSVFACFVYVVFAIELIKGKNKKEAYIYTQRMALEFAESQRFNPKEIQLFARILCNDISQYPENEISSSGYVLHSLEASLWCFLNSGSYSESVLKAVNLGEDTDTTGAITGGLAGLYYGFEGIPEEWIEVLARKEDIEKLCRKLKDQLMK
ncbi:ADP-ribosyl-[dinitrogen reductase] hydrolase [Chryseobacterium sp. SORGH_AS909]|nr:MULTISPECIES: ADP-ribosylglycohydrolase family protein [unclassified Chryseobacterium]MDR6085602.1 ADP-ribosyl-[dinitrogen reductase] hydrolase [Chryseobacterium sp. SORGH_AS_0909]MDR6129964.1 ADP-ribosyl-[dinitrogen reductase] hydrolase [Chryseobacterium sp. SORGH_AS_1175]MDT3407906.1 ADP-ribosyl-[dinitrogen reductase] hydrolase [Pseudacidovorax intermedius]